MTVVTNSLQSLISMAVLSQAETDNLRSVRQPIQVLLQVTGGTYSSDVSKWVPDTGDYEQNPDGSITHPHQFTEEIVKEYTKNQTQIVHMQLPITNPVPAVQ